jgi:serine/threonine-protein kinase
MATLPAPAVADALLALAARPEVTAVALLPAGDAHQVCVDGAAAEARVEARLESALADAVVARLCLLARADLPGAGEQIGRLVVSVGDQRAELVVAVDGRPHGLSAEIRRVVPRDANAVPSPVARPPSSLVTAERIGPYRLQGSIGQGGAGIVYRAHHELLDRPAAIKVLLDENASDPQQVARFLHEARAASRLRSPRVVSVTDFGQTPEGLVYLVMELVEWPTLHRVLDGQALPPARALGLAREIAVALADVHAAGIVHRDVKPGNIFVGPGEQVKLADFGAAKQTLPGVGSLHDTQRGLHFATPEYMSPEHANNRSTDARTDLYALGCVLHQMLSGALPYTGSHALEILIKHTSAPIPEVSSPHGPLPAAVARTVQRLMAKRPEERHQSAAELIVDLEQASRALERRGWRALLP